jgi:hypothetical protein
MPSRSFVTAAAVDGADVEGYAIALAVEPVERQRRLGGRDDCAAAIAEGAADVRGAAFHREVEIG